MLRIVGAIVLACVATASPQDASSTDDEIVVTGSSRDYKLTSKEFAAALKAFRKYRPSFAPESGLWFEVSARGGDPSLTGVQLALTDGRARLPLAMGTDHRIRIPDVAGEGWRLVHAGRPAPIRIRPWVVSPRTDPGNLRLGDLQVQCRVGWAIARQSASFMVAGMFDMIGGCASAKIALYQELGRPIASAMLIEGSRQATVPTLHDTALRMPTYLKGYTSEARLRVTYR